MHGHSLGPPPHLPDTPKQREIDPFSIVCGPPGHSDQSQLFLFWTLVLESAQRGLSCLSEILYKEGTSLVPFSFSSRLDRTLLEVRKYSHPRHTAWGSNSVDYSGKNHSQSCCHRLAGLPETLGLEPRDSHKDLFRPRTGELKERGRVAWQILKPSVCCVLSPHGCRALCVGVTFVIQRLGLLKTKQNRKGEPCSHKESGKRLFLV